MAVLSRLESESESASSDDFFCVTCWVLGGALGCIAMPASNRRCLALFRRGNASAVIACTHTSSKGQQFFFSHPKGEAGRVRSNGVVYTAQNVTPRTTGHSDF